MTRKEKKLYEQMRQYQPPDVEAEKYFEMQKKCTGRNRKGKKFYHDCICLRESGSRQNICQSGFGLRKESFLWQESY